MQKTFSGTPATASLILSAICNVNGNSHLRPLKGRAKATHLKNGEWSVQGGQKPSSHEIFLSGILEERANDYTILTCAELLSLHRIFAIWMKI